MGRSTFTEVEAHDIRRLLREKGIADRDRQKSIRGSLRRKYDFYISDFSTDADGFTAADFDACIARGRITIAEAPMTHTAVPTVASPAARSTSARPTDAAGHALPDVLSPSLRIVFCGTAAGSTSARIGAYYAGSGNRFWSILATTGLTPRLLHPSEFRRLPEFGIGLTDLAKFESGADAALSSGAFDVNGLRARMALAQPRILAFNGKAAGEAFLGRRVDYGLQRESISSTAIHVLPSTSGAARGSWNESYWVAVAEAAST